MKKTLTLSLLLTMSPMASASIDFLEQSVLSTLAVHSQSRSLDHVEAIGANLAAYEVETRILDEQPTRGSQITEYGCHLHGNQMACHPHGHSHFKQASFGEFLDSIRLSFASLRQSFAARGISESALEEAKFWKGGHQHFKGGDEVFGKFVYEVGGTEETIFTECHRHSANDPVDCHFTFSGEDEPDLGGGHQH